MGEGREREGREEGGGGGGGGGGVGGRFPLPKTAGAAGSKFKNIVFKSPYQARIFCEVGR